LRLEGELTFPEEVKCMVNSNLFYLILIGIMALTAVAEFVRKIIKEKRRPSNKE